MPEIFDRTLDFLSLFKVISSTENTFLETKKFLSDRFLISFDSIAEDINSSKDINLDEIFSIIYHYTYGYSLSHFNECIYGDYTNTDRIMSFDRENLKKLDEQLKLHCIISSLYTISAITECNHERLLNLPNYYDEKTYFRAKEKTFTIPKIIGNDKESIGKISRAFSSLTKQTLNKKTPLLNEHILGKYLNYYYGKNSSPEIAKFLREFSFDLIVNQMQGGLNFVTTLKTISSHQKGDNNYRREVKRFLTKMKLLDKNFVSTDKSNPTVLLYNWKKEHCFHINMLKYLIEQNDCLEIFNAAETLLSFPVMLSLKPLDHILHKESSYIDFILKYLSGITFPVFKYSFFIAICEHWNYSLEDIKDPLLKYLNTYSFESLNYSHELDSNSIFGNKIDTLGSALLQTYHADQYATFKPFDDSFEIKVQSLNTEYPLCFYQGTIGLAYYKNILC